jgi:uncharacterized protein (DUF362 family)
MGAVYDEFERQLAAWRRQYAGRPRQEMLRLFLLALEREEIVAVGYREAAIARRLRAMPLTPEVRDLVRHALLWVWKDEEMHAVYIRGAILRLGSPRLKAAALAMQLAGAVGGWSGSVRHHARWREAPLSRALATLSTWAGTLVGKVPADVRRHLRYGPFRDFCLFNVDAENTAWLCWERLLELAATQADFPPHLADDFRRIRDDEDRHGRVFQALADALDEHDRLAPGQTPEGLAERIAAVGEYFLPRTLRRRAGADNPLGSGGAVHVVVGRTAEEKLPLFRRLLDEVDLEGRLRESARACGKPVAALRVAIKPTFMMGYHRKDRSVVTDPELLDALAERLRTLGCADVAVVESPNLYDRFYRGRGVREVAEYFGFTSPHYRLADLSGEQVPHVFGRGLAQYTVGRTWKEADFRISFGKLRSHPVDMFHLSLGNVEAVGARCDEFLFPERQAQRETAVMMLLDDFPPHLALLEGYDTAADGLVGVMGCPRPPAPRRLYAGGDALAVDLVAGRHLGLRDPRQSRTVRTACHWFGDPSDHVRVVGRDEPVRGWHHPYHNEMSALLSFFAFPVYVHGSGRGSLFVPEMDEKAFPPVRPERGLLRLARRAVRRLLGLHHTR